MDALQEGYLWLFPTGEVEWIFHLDCDAVLVDFHQDALVSGIYFSQGFGSQGHVSRLISLKATSMTNRRLEVPLC